MIPFEISERDGFLVMEDFPENCIFLKVKTGCGGTTIVLENNENYVIAVPTTELITNKCYPTRDKEGNAIHWKMREQVILNCENPYTRIWLCRKNGQRHIWGFILRHNLGVLNHPLESALNHLVTTFHNNFIPIDHSNPLGLLILNRSLCTKNYLSKNIRY